VCVAAGTSGSTEPTWTVTKGAKTTDNTVTWQEITGQAGVNGDLTNCPKWTAIENTALALGYVIQDVAGDTLFVVTTAGTTNNSAEPTWSKTAGATTTDGTVIWTSLGAVGNFPAWGAPHARMGNASASGWMAAGDTCFVSNNHAATQAASLTIASSGTTAAPIKFYCVSDSTAPSATLATSASESVTGANSLTFNSYTSITGVIFNCGNGSSGNALTTFSGDGGYFENCAFNSKSTNNGTGSGFAFNGNVVSAIGSGSYLLNCTFTFGAAGQDLNSGASGIGYIVGGSIALTGTAPAILLSTDNIANRWIGFTFRDVDLSGITGTLVDFSGSDGGIYLFENCKLASGVAPTIGTPIGLSMPALKMYNCDNAGTDYRYYIQSFLGLQKNENTIVRSGGASDGTTSVSWNITTSSGANIAYPFIAEEIFQWSNLASSTHTCTVYLTSNTALNTNDIWLEFEYPGSASSPLGSLSSTRAAPLSALTSLTTDNSTWGGSTTYKYKLVASFNPASAGVVKGRIFVAKPSVTVYVDPLLNLA
jgi:hypothetical protein